MIPHMNGGIVYRKANGKGLVYRQPPGKPIAVDAKSMSVKAVLTTPIADSQGDIVDPTGFDDSVHRLNPVVFLDHHQGSHKLPIGKAETPTGDYTVASITLPDGRPAIVGETFFSQKSKVATEIFELVSEDILRGVSMGFMPAHDDRAVPLPGAVSVIRKSRGDERGSFHFHEWTLHEYSHTPQPVNPEALTIRIEKSRAGGWSPELTRAIEPFLITKSRRPAMVRGGYGGPSVVNKAMDEIPMEPEVAEPAEPLEDDMAAEMDVDDSVTPTARAAYDGAQGLMDLATMIEELLAKGEHVKGKQKLMKCLENLRSEAEELTAIGDMVSGELGGKSDEESDTEPDPEPIETGDDGEIVVKGGYRPTRVARVQYEADGKSVIVAKSKSSPRRYTLAEVTKSRKESSLERRFRTAQRTIARAARIVQQSPK